MAGTENDASVTQTHCCVVGGGPAGVMLSYLLARQGIPVTLLEAHQDFDRDFRGDTIHPSVMEILSQLGLAERLLELPHGKMRKMTFRTEEGSLDLVDFSHLGSTYPYVTMLPQVDFLNFMVDQARQYLSFNLVMGASVQRLVERDGIIRGVQYRDENRQWKTVEALLTVGTDGRFSKVRQLLEMEPVETAPPMDVLWFRLPRKESDVTEAGGGVIGRGCLLIMLNRRDDWQLGYVFPKGSYQQIKAAGLPALRASIAAMAPWMADRVDTIQDWKQVSLLSVASSRCKRWYRPGALLIGDAAHVMSPVGGVGINYAIQDAVVAANVLSKPLSEGRMTLHQLAEVQRQRSLPTRFIQGFQRIAQRQVVSKALSRRRFRIPWLLRLLLKLPLIRALPARIIGIGLRRVSVNSELKL